MPHGEEFFFISCFQIDFCKCLSFIFPVVFFVSCYDTRIEILLYLVWFCPPKSMINSFSLFNFLGFRGTFSRAEKHNVISCLMTSFTHPIEFFLLTFSLAFEKLVFRAEQMRMRSTENSKENSEPAPVFLHVLKFSSEVVLFCIPEC